MSRQRWGFVSLARSLTRFISFAECLVVSGSSLNTYCVVLSYYLVSTAWIGVLLATHNVVEGDEEGGLDLIRGSTTALESKLWRPRLVPPVLRSFNLGCVSSWLLDVGQWARVAVASSDRNEGGAPT